MTNDRTIRLGLVGLGKIARDQHLPSIRDTDGIELVAVASRNVSEATVPSYGTLEAMLEGADALDAVVMCQPPQARFQAALAVLEAGKHVFLEKPPGMTLSEVEILIDRAQGKGVTLFASWHSREAAGVRRAREWLVGRAITSAFIKWTEDVRVWHPGQAWIWEPGGFGVFDPGINALSILTAIMPQPLRVIGSELSFPQNRQAPIAARLDLESECGAPIEATFDFRPGAESWDIGVSCRDGELLLREGGSRLVIDGNEVRLGAASEYRALYSRFVDLVRNGRSDIDLAPLRLVADAFLCGRISRVEPFVE